MPTFILLLISSAIGLAVFLAPGPLAARQSSPTEACSRVGNDDTVRRFEASLREGFVRAYKRLFPDDRSEPDAAALKTASFRCMDGHLLACFVGANLPCGKLDVSRTNRGASEFCRQHPNQEIVPMSATGHDTVYSFTCVKTRAEVKESIWKVDSRGFGVELWKPMD